ncbi:hypothetical protein [Azotobacter salinestris]|uniref:hypothetical protein n=1 Tax=Azotobacter salinestris TaxID=69964 RepID=UPI0032DF3A87
MNVQVIDLKSGKLKTMGRKYAEVLVKMKRARWPDPPGTEYQAKVLTAADPVATFAVVEESAEEHSEEQPATKKRGRTHKAQE